MNEKSSVTVLLVEDDETDRESVRRSFKKHNIKNPLVIAENGEEALNLLKGIGSRPLKRPYLVLLDLNMPRMNGIEFLAALRADPSICDSVVFVLTTSDADKDKVSAYEQHIAGYIVKDNTGQGFQGLIELLDHYWQIVEMPPEKFA